MSSIVDVTQAVVDFLNNGSFSQSIAAERAYQVKIALESGSALQVLVAPKGHVTDIWSREGI